MSLPERGEVGVVFSAPSLSGSPKATSSQSKKWDPGFLTPNIVAFPVPSKDWSKLAHVYESWSLVISWHLGQKSPLRFMGQAPVREDSLLL